MIANFILMLFKINRVNNMIINNLIQQLTFDHSSSRHVNDIMIKAFPFISRTDYEFLKCEKVGRTWTLTPVKNREKDLNLIKEYVI